MASSEFARETQPVSGANEKIRNVLVIGAGWVGRQIVGQFVAHGLKVTWLDQSRGALDSGLEWVSQHIQEIREASKYPADGAALSSAALDDKAMDDQSSKHGSGADAVQACLSLDEVQGSIDLVLETVTEQVSVKRKVLERASASFPAPTIIASNSSYFTPSILSRFVSDPSRFANYHFHVPVWRTRLVDIAASPQTSDSTLDRLAELSGRVGQHPIVQRVENPGYVFNWMLKALLQSALQLSAKEVATPEDIDLAWKKVTGMPVGPFGIMDQIGLDLMYQTMSAARFVDGDAVWQPLLDQLSPLVDAGKLGVKTGSGFYVYAKPSPDKPA